MVRRDGARGGGQSASQLAHQAASRQFVEARARRRRGRVFRASPGPRPHRSAAAARHLALSGVRHHDDVAVPLHRLRRHRTRHQRDGAAVFRQADADGWHRALLGPRLHRRFGQRDGISRTSRRPPSPSAAGGDRDAAGPPACVRGVPSPSLEDEDIQIGLRLSEAGRGEPRSQFAVRHDLHRGGAEQSRPRQLGRLGGLVLRRLSRGAVNQAVIAETPRCPLCGSGTGHKERVVDTAAIRAYWQAFCYSLDAEFAPLPETLTGWRCGQCQLAWFDPPLIGGPSLYAALAAWPPYYRRQAWEWPVAIEILARA